MRANILRFLESLLLSVTIANGASIVWVSDAPAPGFSGPGTNLTDQGFITLLQAAGYNVTRYNSPDAAATTMTPDEIAALNTNDLVIIGKAVTSTPFTGAQGAQWNSAITKPLICVNAYLTRQNRLGWFGGNNSIPDSTTSRLTAAVTNLVTEFLFAGVDMSGVTTVELYDQLIDRNSTHILDPMVAGGQALATTTFAREDNGSLATAIAIAEWPAGTAVRNGADILGGYRLYFSTSHRESAAAPNGVPTHSGRENLTPTGENIFLRAVQHALGNGVAFVDLEPMRIVEEPPAEISVVQGRPLKLGARITGGGPRTLAWQRLSEDGVTFTNIPPSTTPFSATVLDIPAVTMAEDNATFRIYAENALDSMTSRNMILHVFPDNEGPRLLSVSSSDGLSATAFFDEVLDSTQGTIADPINYQLVGNDLVFVATATLRPDQRSVHLTFSEPLTNGLFELGIDGLKDQFGNTAEPHSQSGVNAALTFASIGTLNPGGTNVGGPLLGADMDTFEVTAGGLDIIGAADQMQFGYRMQEGDFDVSVFVASLIGTNRHELNAKAILSARESLDTGARSVTIYATPPAPGDDTAVMLVRNTVSTAPVVVGTLRNAGATNIVLRLKREGDTFSTFWKQVGGEWMLAGTNQIALPQSLYVGVGAVSHRNGQFTTALFGDFRSLASIEPQPVTILNPTFTAGTFSFSIQTQANARYVVEFKESLADATWNELTEHVGTGNLDLITPSHQGPAETGARFYRVRSL